MFFSVLLMILNNHYDKLTAKLSDFLEPKSMSYYFITIPNIFVAFCFQPCFFPLFTSLKDRTSHNGMKFTVASFGFAFFVYILISILSLFIFGSEVRSDVLINISKSKYEFKYLLLVMYLVISAMHMPMVFFAGKEAVLNIYIESKNHAISKHCDMIRQNDFIRK